MSNIPPCYDIVTKKDCELRHTGCHTTCERWAKYVEARNLDYEHRKNMAEVGAGMHAVYTTHKQKALREAQLYPRRYK